MSDDETSIGVLMTRLAALESAIDSLSGDHPRNDPFKDIFFVSSTGQEQRVNTSNALEDWTPDGRSGLSLIEPGSKIAVVAVRLGEAYKYVKINSGVIPVNVTKTGGSDGSQTTTASWTYTVTSESGTTLGTAIAPAMQRPKGTRTPAHVGLAYYNSSGVIVLQWCDEVEGTGGCN